MGKKIDVNFNSFPSNNNYKIKAEKIGMDEYLYSSLCFEVQNKLNVFDKKRFNSLENELICKVVNEELLENMLSILNVLKRHGTCVWKSSGVSGKITGPANKYSYYAEITIEDNNVQALTCCQDIVTRNKYLKNKDTYEISKEIVKKNQVIYMDRDDIYNNNISKEYISEFNYDNVELSRKEIINHSNYIYNKKTTANTLVETKDRENTQETKEYNRIGNKVLYSYELKFFNKDYKYENGEFHFNKDLINKEEYYQADNFRPDDKLIPKMLFFERIDYERFLELKETKENSSNKKLFKKRK